MRQTFFGHFCAGENNSAIKPVIDKLSESGVRSILDYAAEADVPAEKARPRDGIVSARTFDYAGEDECDANVNTFKFCINVCFIHSLTPISSSRYTINHLILFGH